MNGQACRLSKRRVPVRGPVATHRIHATCPTARYIEPMTHPASDVRLAAVRRGQWLTWATLVHGSLEAVLAVGAGLLAHSVVLVAFGLDSAIEVSASGAAMWRLYRDSDVDDRAHAERTARHIIGVLFLILAGYIALDAVHALVGRSPTGASRLGVVIAVASLVVMPLLARAKRRVAAELGSEALRAEARQTDVCAYLSAILLLGLVLNALLGWWWADSAAALLMVPLVAWEGCETLRGRALCDDCMPGA